VPGVCLPLAETSRWVCRKVCDWNPVSSRVEELECAIECEQSFAKDVQECRNERDEDELDETGNGACYEDECYACR